MRRYFVESEPISDVEETKERKGLISDKDK